MALRRFWDDFLSAKQFPDIDVRYHPTIQGDDLITKKSFTGTTILDLRSPSWSKKSPMDGYFRFKVPFVSLLFEIAAFVGIAFEKPVSVVGFATGRDSNGHFFGRYGSDITLEYTTVTNPTFSTQLWHQIGHAVPHTLELTGYYFSQPVSATGFRLQTTDGTQAFEELVLYTIAECKKFSLSKLHLFCGNII